MSKLKCNLYFSPTLEVNKEINYLCYDKKIHIRFKDFNEPEVISGFEKKLIYLLSYLFNYAYLPTTITSKSNNELINDFLKNSMLDKIYNCIRLRTHDEFKGIKLKQNYKKYNCKPFGKLSIDCFPINTKLNITKIQSCEIFLDVFEIDLYSYLFDDRYSIVIDTYKPAKFNKFERKQMKKEERQTIDSDLVQLW